MKKILSRLVLMSFDVLAIYLSIVLAFLLRVWLEPYFGVSTAGDLHHYTDKLIVYIIVIVTFFGLDIYKYRHDFWEETHLILKALAISLVLVLSVLALSKSVGSYSRVVVVTSFIMMALLLPTFKFFLKKKLFVFGLWGRKAAIISQDSEVINAIFDNRYLGYTESSESESDVVFVDTFGKSKEAIELKLSNLFHQNKEVVFIPILNSFNYANAGIIEIFNARKNMIILENSLLKRGNTIIKRIADLFLSILLIPLLVPVFAILIFFMKKEEPKGSIFFKQDRLGKDGNVFVCYKFRSMNEDGDAILQEYLKKNPQEVENYTIYHKYENDPRITKIGALMRKTSLDELPQIINVFKGEMSLIGPRPYMLNEKEKIGDRIDMVLAVPPGITGLWQVSGRSDVDFHSRVDMDVYYTRNWNLWLDFVVLIKTIKTVLFRDGAS
jgi:undecaprenyl-phosphate galactose phosphotransferase